jgi:hypothetical protein
MKTYSIFKSKKASFLLMSLLLIFGCQTDDSDLQVVKRSTLAEIFTDTPIGMGSNFYFPYGPSPDNPPGSKFTAWTVDQEVSYKGNASMRFDVPNADDSEGNFAGAIFRVDGGGRDLSGYDALTFWAKASQGVTISEFGFGEDFFPNKYITTLVNVSLGTNWTKIIIPIPDASKLVNEKGMLRYAAGTSGTNNKAYTFWIDELKFEKLGTIAHPQPKIMGGLDVIQQTFIGAKIELSTKDNPLTVTFNMASGRNQTVSAAPSYFAFTSSNTGVATVNELGVVSVIGSGTSVITATLGGVNANGSLTVTSLGNLTAAPIPSQLQSNVKSVFSDTYSVATPINFDPKFGGSTTATSKLTVNNNSFLSYANNNYTGIMFGNTIDASDLTFMHVDVYVQEAGVQIQFEIRDIGANGVINTNENNGQPILDDKDYRYTTFNSTVNGWNSFDIPLAGNIANQKNNLGAIIVVGGPNFILDNIYFFGVPTGPTTAAPTPTVSAANVVSVFSNAYTNIASDLNPAWGQATVVTQESIAGNNTLKYTGLNYQGITFDANQNVAGMTHLHIDYYSVDSTSLNAFIISPGPVEKAKVLSVPTNSGWNSIEIPLSELSPVDLSNVFQMKFDGNGTIFLDNIYFHN